MSPHCASIGRLCVLLLAMIGWHTPVSAQSPPSASAPHDTTGTGFLVIELYRDAPDSLYLVIDEAYEAPHYVANGDTLAVPVGERYVTVATEQNHDVTFSAEIRAGETQLARVPVRREHDRSRYLSGSSYPVLHRGINLLVETDWDSRVVIDGARRGQGTMGLRVDEGSYAVRAVHAAAGEGERVVFVETNPPRLTHVVLYNKPSRERAWALSPLPGAAQMHKHHYLRSIAILGAFSAASVGAARNHHRLRPLRDSYHALLSAYENSTDEDKALKLGEETAQAYQEARDAQQRRNLYLGLTAGVYLYSLLDAWLDTPRGGYRSPRPRTIRLMPFADADQRGLHLSVPL